jgi:hypothetical protein
MLKIDLRWVMCGLLLCTTVACESGADRDETVPATDTSSATSSAAPAPAATAPAATVPAATVPPSPPAAAPEQAPPAESGGEPSGVDRSPTPTPAPAQSQAEVPRLSVIETRALVDAGRAVVVDVRDGASYNNEHVKGALHIPLEQIATRASELPLDRRIITYCA